MDRSGEMKPPVFSAEIEQRIAMRFELSAHHAADEYKMIASLVKRFALAFERYQRAAK